MDRWTDRQIDVQTEIKQYMYIPTFLSRGMGYKNGDMIIVFINNAL